METTDAQEVQKMIDASLNQEGAFATKKLGDIPTDKNQLANKAYVDRKIIFIKASDDNTSPVAGDDYYQFNIPEGLDGFELADAEAAVVTPSVSGGPINLQVRNATGDMLTTPITIDDNEPTSYTAAVRSVVSTTNFRIHTGDLIHIDVDAAGSGALGLQIYLSVQ